MPYSDKLVLQNVWLSSWVLSLSILGDALLYVILPVHADVFGVSMLMVGFLLAVNRIARTFTYSLIVSVAEHIGLKKLCLIAASTAIISTLGYSLLDGAFWLSLSRALWGLSYAALLVVTLSYAAINPSKIGTRVGLSRSIEQVGPLVAITAGAWLANLVGPKTVFGYLALASSISIVFAVMLFEKKQSTRLKKTPNRTQIFSQPNSLDALIFWMGAGVDGIFIMSISLMWSQYVNIELAILFGGGVLAAQRLSEMVFAPCAGIIADQFGSRLPIAVAIMISILGFVLIGLKWLLLGSCLLVLARGALGTLFAATVAEIYSDHKIKALARNQAWRDIGAAVGPLVAGASLTLTTLESLHIALALAFSITFWCFVKSPGWRALKAEK